MVTIRGRTFALSLGPAAILASFVLGIDLSPIWPESLQYGGLVAYIQWSLRAVFFTAGSVACLVGLGLGIKWQVWRLDLWWPTGLLLLNGLWLVFLALYPLFFNLVPPIP